MNFAEQPRKSYTLSKIIDANRHDRINEVSINVVVSTKENGFKILNNSFHGSMTLF